MRRLLVALPVYNECRHVRAVLEAVCRYADHILVIDDGSTDGTGDVLRRYDHIQLIRHKHNQGYGQSLIDAFAWGTRWGYGWIITLDCDHQHEPSYIPRFEAEIDRDDADIISGSRYLLPCGDDAPPPERMAINRMITNLLNGRLNLALTDAFCGFKAYRTRALAPLTLSERGYGLPLQLWIQAGRAGLRIREIPVPLIYHDPSRCFPGVLSDSTTRMRYYLRTIKRELHYGADPRSRTDLHSKRNGYCHHAS